MTKTTEKKPRGRPRYCFSYQEAAQIAQSEGITSAKEYAKWWKFNLPSRMPKRPDAAYRSQGFSWLYFLGGNNTFPMARNNTVDQVELEKNSPKTNIVCSFAQTISS